MLINSIYPLRPFPELESQNKIVNFFSELSSGLQKISSFIAYPFKKISSLFSFNSKISLTDKNIYVTGSLFLKSPTQGFDQKCHYVIQEGKIYFKPIAADKCSTWKEISFSRKAIALSADGDNLIVLDEHRRVHYAKTDGIHFHLTKDHWEVSAFKIQWQKNWFNMDFVAPIANFFKPAGIYPMEGARSVAMSHKGVDTLYYADIVGKKHPDPFVGVTTLYQLDPTGTRILFADPWLSNHFHNEITAPEEGRFIAENMDASASTLFLIQRAKDREGKEIHKMYTRYADFDSIGSNPLLPSTYDRKNQTALVRVLPAEDWLEQPSIDLQGRARLTKKITISQTGRGQEQRQLRVEGTDAEGCTGYYEKMIYEKTWRFQQIDHFISERDFLGFHERGEGLRQGKQIAHDYYGSIRSEEGVLPAVLKNFSTRGLNERNLHTSIEMKDPSGKTHSYTLHARRGLRHLLGFETKEPYWTLISPDSKIQSVKVRKNKDRISILNNRVIASFPLEGNPDLPLSFLTLTMRIYSRVALFFLGLVKDTFKLTRRISDKIFVSKDALIADERLRQSLLIKDNEDTKKVIQRLTTKNPQLAPQSVLDLIFQPAIFTHLRKAMKGANIVVEQGGERLFEELKKTPGVKPRISSHASMPGTCHGVETPLFGELLFWMDKEGKFRFQFEAHSVRTLFKLYYHFYDYVKYRSHGKQQGKYGSSTHTDASPVVIERV